VLTFFPESKNTGRIDRADQRHLEDDPKDFRSRAISKTLIGLSPIRLLLTSGNHYDAVVPVGEKPLEYCQWRDGEHLDEAYAQFLFKLYNP